MPNFTHRESLVTLETTLKNYLQQLSDQLKVLRNASQVCDHVMGSDDLVSHYIGELEKSLKFLEASISDLEDLQNKVRQKIELIDNLLK